MKKAGRRNLWRSVLAMTLAVFLIAGGSGTLALEARAAEDETEVIGEEQIILGEEEILLEEEPLPEEEILPEEEEVLPEEESTDVLKSVEDEFLPDEEILSEESALAVKKTDALNWLRAQEGVWWGSGQCTEFVTAYMNYVVTGNPHSGTYGRPHAKDYNTVANSDPGNWEVIQNYYDFVPQPGDIFVSTGLFANYGHIGVVLSSDINNAVIVDQNARNSTGNGTSAWVHDIVWNGSYSPRYFIRFRNWASEVDTSHNPAMTLDLAVSNSPGTISVRGWAFDPDDVNAQLVIDFYANINNTMVYIGNTIANTSRPDVHNVYGCGSNHGFSTTLYSSVGSGSFPVYAAAINIGQGDNAWSAPITCNLMADTIAPTISNVKVTDISPSGYTVTCTVTDNVKVDRVQFPTWTIYNGQDDLAPSWDTNSIVTGTINGNTVTFRVNKSEHNNEIGDYATHIYAFDKAGNVSSIQDMPLVTVPSAATGIALNRTTASVESGKTLQLKATVSPSDAIQEVTWSSSNRTVATVDANGKVTAKAAGSAKITATTKDGTGLSASCTVTVKENTDDLTRDFITRAYKEILGRNPDTKGMNYWLTELKAKRIGGGQMCAQFLKSKEFQNKKYGNDKKVEIAYKAFFDRRPDASGKAYWKGLLDNGVSEAYIARGMAGSTEFKNICGKYGIAQGTVSLTENRDKNAKVTAFVARCYRESLGRNGEADGLNYWTGEIIARRITPAKTAEGFVFSKEMNNKGYNNNQFVQMLYRLCMGRTYDRTGLNYWLNQMNKGMTRQQVFTSFVNSQEFLNIVAGYGL